MAKSPQPAANRRARRSVRNAQNQLPVFTDPGFVRVFADQAVVLMLGRDLDLAFIAAGPKIETVSSNRSDPNGQAVKMKPSYNEVARVRMPPASAAFTAMNVLQQLTERGFINKEEMLKTIQEFEEPELEHEEDNDEFVDGGDDQ